jgi:hypothetical protein
MPACVLYLVQRVDDGLQEVVEEEGDGEGDEDGPQHVEHDAEAEQRDGEEADGHQVFVAAELPWFWGEREGKGVGGVVRGVKGISAASSTAII